MYRSIRASSLASSSTLLLSLTSFFLLTVGAAFAQVNSAEVTALKFVQEDLPLGNASSNDGSSNAIVTGDFNNDGILDVVTVNGGTSGITVSFFKGLGGGRFSTTPVNSTLYANTQTPAGGPAFAADFNRDGKLDLAMAAGVGLSSQTGAVTIALGNGDGTFTLGQSFTPPTDNGLGNASTIALADFNGDHIPDIAVSDAISGYTWIYLGKGDGTFSLADSKSSGGGNSVVAGDFNADGKQDVAFTSGTGGSGSVVGVFLGNGNGSLNNPTTVTVTGGAGSVSGTAGLAVGDFYNDRIQTLAVLYAIGQPDLYSITYLVPLKYSNGELLEGPLNQVTGEVAEGPLYVAGGDLNGDFIFDVFITGGGYYENPLTQYMLGYGNGTFLTPQNAPYDSQGTTFVYPVIRDMNLDSRHDVAIAWSNLVDDNGGGEVAFNANATPNCDPPPANALSVNICEPVVNGNTYTFKAAGNAFNGIVKRMELWIDGKKVGENLEDQLNVTTTVAPGTHTASFVVVDSFDSYTSKSATFTVK